MKIPKKDYLLLMVSCLLLLKGCSQKNDTATYTTVFPMNEYLTISDGTPFPTLKKEPFQNINTNSFVNVMDYGATGDGSIADDAAIIKAFQASKNGSGVLFPKNKTFLIQNLIHIPLNKNIIVVAYGATFRMAPNTGYNAIAFEDRNDSECKYKVIWLGGLFDGNKNNQAWPGSPTGNNNWIVSQGNYGLLTIRHAKCALVKDVNLINSVYDGIELHSCDIGIIADCLAEEGAPLNYSTLKRKLGEGRQATYFKVTRTASRTAYFINLICKGGSIGIQYSAKPVNDSSLALVTGCKFYNQAQDALHFEHCRKVFIYNSLVHADNTLHYRPDIHISNNCMLASIEKSRLENGRIDFRTANALKAGIVKNCQFFSSSLNKQDTSGAITFIKNATLVVNCTFQGWTRTQQVTAKYVDNCQFKNFKTALQNVHLASKCKFINGDTVLAASKNNDVFQECTFADITNMPSNLSGKIPRTISNVGRKMVMVNLKFIDSEGKFLGELIY